MKCLWCYELPPLEEATSFFVLIIPQSDVITEF